VTIGGVHRVRRQSWRLRVGSAPAAFAARARFRAEVEDLLPAFGRAFDARAPGDAVVRIPRLDLALRVGSLDQIAGALDAALERALDEALQREPPAAPRTPPPAAAADALTLLVRYLESGMLEWHAAHAEPHAIAAVLRAALLAQLSAAVRAAPPAAAAPETAMQFWARLLGLLPPERWPEVAALLDAAPLPRAARAPGEEPPAPEAVASAGTADAAAAVRAIVAARLDARSAIALAAAVLAAARGHALAPAQLRAALASIAGTPAPLPDAPAPVARLLRARTARADPAPAEAPAAALRMPAPAARPGAEPAARPFPLMAENAGLVLLHPFLPRLLEACALYRPGERLAPHALPRAAALLHGLARGGDEVHEFELGFVKILLGLRPDDPLPVGPGLVGEREREEGEALLAAAIAHWGALKGTSIAGLRVAFLQRRGALREEDAGWRLQPEPESFDVLLDQLPWTLATVKLPWMTRPLFTDWPTR
jgi:contractile injection system tape measure protein